MNEVQTALAEARAEIDSLVPGRLQTALSRLADAVAALAPAEPSTGEDGGSLEPAPTQPSADLSGLDPKPPLSVV